MTLYFNQHSIRILAGLFLLTATVLVNSYSGTLASLQSVPKFEPAINSLEDLANSQNVVMTLMANSVLAQIVVSLYLLNRGTKVHQFMVNLYLNGLP